MLFLFIVSPRLSAAARPGPRPREGERAGGARAHQRRGRAH